MTCVICKTGSYSAGLTTVVLIRGNSAVIIKEVPAQVCDQCGEYILSDEVSEKLLQIAHEAHINGTEVEIRRFAA